jgi:hypothetical protein
VSPLVGCIALIGIMAIVILALAIFLSRASLSSDRRHGTSGSLSGALLHAQSLIEPGKENVAEAVEKAEERTSDDDASGDPPQR